MLERITKAASAARETVDVLLALAEYARCSSLEELREVTNERDKLRADYESTGCIGREMDRLQTQVKCLVSENEDLKAKLEWLRRWRNQSKAPCPFAIGDIIEYSVRDSHGLCIVEELEPCDIWRPTSDSLNLYDKYKNI